MRFRVIALESLAIFVSYLVLSLSLVSATNVNIIFNGQVQETAKYEQERLVNMAITMGHDPADITWTNVKLVVNLNSASLANSIKKIYLYKCRSQTPTECARLAPQVFDNYVDTELLWKDISEKTSPAQYPQIANLLFIVKLEDMNKKENWVGFFTQTRQTAYNIFDTTQLSIQNIDLYASSIYLVEPIKNYIENKMMVPFKWATRVVFSDANPLYAIGASAQEADSHTFQTAVVSSSEITSINKDFYFVFPKTSSGIASPVVLNLNPSFSCGNGICESDIGETSSMCCYDCGCATGYCDTAANINLSSCKSESMGLSIISASSPLISDCAKGFNANISVRITNPPASISHVSGTVSLNGSLYSVACPGSSGSYDCTVSLSSGIKCGGGSYVIGPGLINLTVTYKDGPNSVTKSLGMPFSGVSVNYDCKCPDGSYCDSLKKTCQSEGAITLGITKITSYLDNYNPGDRIYLSAKIFNPPGGLVLVDKSATMNLTNGQVAPGTPDCSAPNSQFEYNCSIPFQITNYQNTNAYTFSPNTLFFTITYNDGPLAKTKTISAPFGPVSIPSQACGDGQCNMGESQETCCLDCGCPSPGTQYCDRVNGCTDLSSVSISVNSVNPANFTDCREPHSAYLGVAVNNAPTDMSLDYSAYLQNGLVKGWNLHCEPSALNIFNCTLVIPPLESEGCSLPYKVISGNSLNMTVSFPDGKSKQVTRHLNAPFQNIMVAPIYHCGDGTCESSLLESASNCCYDCPCKDSPSYGEAYYCDFNQDNYLGGCLPKANITLVIDSPKSEVSFSSCELTNSVNVKAHIENQPATARPQYFYATLNGSSAEMIYCDPQQSFGSSNYTFNCTLMVPKIYACSQGKTYTFSPNSMAVLLSYQNGRQKTEVITLTASLPTITIKQGIRTLYDITQAGIKKMKQNLQKTMQIARDMLDAIKDCMEMVKTLAYLQLILTVAGAIYGGISGQSSSIPQPQGGMTSGSFGGAVAGAYWGSTIGKNLMDSYVAMCNFLQAQYQIDIKVQEMELKMINMEMCMEMYQHQLDIGQCDKNPESCFSSITSCINSGMSAVSSTANDISNIMNTATKNLATSTGLLGNVYGTVGVSTGLSSLGGGGNPYIQMKCGDRTLALPTDFCCNVGGTPTYVGTGVPQCRTKLNLNLVIANNGGCNVIITEKTDASSNYQYHAQGAWSTPSEQITEGKAKYRFYCYDTANNYFQNQASKDKFVIRDADKKEIVYEIDIKRNLDSTGKCDCSSVSGVQI